MTQVLARRDEAFTPDEIAAFLRRRLGDGLLDTTLEYGTFTVTLDAGAYVEAARLLAEHDRFRFVLFDCLFGVDARDEGFDVIAVVYAPEFGQRVLLRHRCAGGRETPVAPTLTAVHRGADWHERETWDMFGIEFEGHPGLAPRILCAENFEGWPLRKDFYLATREAKPWPGVKEPAELDEDGNVIERIPGPGGAPGPMDLDKAMAEQAKLANPELEELVVSASPEDVADPTEVLAAEPQDTSSADAADRAEDSDQVLVGEQERAREDVEAATSDAKARAEERRVAAAEARARRAASREADEPVSTPEEEVAEVPEGRARTPRSPGEAGAPGDPTGPRPERGDQESPIQGGIHETAETSRERGEADVRPDDAPVAPEQERDAGPEDDAGGDA